MENFSYFHQEQSIQELIKYLFYLYNGIFNKTRSQVEFNAFARFINNSYEEGFNIGLNQTLLHDFLDHILLGNLFLRSTDIHWEVIKGDFEEYSKLLEDRQTDVIKHPAITSFLDYFLNYLNQDTKPNIHKNGLEGVDLERDVFDPANKNTTQTITLFCKRNLVMYPYILAYLQAILDDWDVSLDEKGLHKKPELRQKQEEMMKGMAGFNKEFNKTFVETDKIDKNGKKIYALKSISLDPPTPEQTAENLRLREEAVELLQQILRLPITSEIAKQVKEEMGKNKNIK